jgi:hypothetical protein
MKFLGEDGKSFTMKELNKQIKKMLTLQMKLEYINLSGDTLNDKKAILAGAMDKLDTYAKINKAFAESKQKQKNNNEKMQMKRAMTQKAKSKDGRKATAMASQKCQIFARLTMVNMIGATVKTILAQISSRRTTTAVKVTKPRPMVTRR